MLTVLLASHNGQHTLPAVLRAYERLYPPPGGWKLVVIDNGSTDYTSKILAKFSSSLPMTQLNVSAPGKNRALNAGLESRSGDLMIFTDDDAIPEPDWLIEMRRAADDNADFDIFGGTIRPYWERPPEPWHLNS